MQWDLNERFSMISIFVTILIILPWLVIGTAIYFDLSREAYDNHGYCGGHDIPQWTSPPEGGEEMIFDPIHNVLFLAMEDGLGIYDVTNQTFRLIRVESYSEYAHQVHDITIDDDYQTLYFSYSYGLGTFNIQQGLSNHSYKGEKYFDEDSDTGNPVDLTYNNRTRNIMVGRGWHNEVIYIRNHNILIEGKFSGHPNDVGNGELIFHYLNNDTIIQKLTLADGVKTHSFAYDEKRDLLYIGAEHIYRSTPLYGLIIYDFNNDSFEFRNRTNGLPADTIWDMVLDERNDKLYLGTWGQGVVIYSIENNTFRNVTFGSNLIASIELNQIDNRLYVTSYWRGAYFHEIDLDSL